MIPPPEHTLKHGECSSQVRTAHLNSEDAGADNTIADTNQNPEARKCFIDDVRKYLTAVKHEIIN